MPVKYLGVSLISGKLSGKIALDLQTESHQELRARLLSFYYAGRLQIIKPLFYCYVFWSMHFLLPKEGAVRKLVWDGTAREESEKF